MLTLVRLPLCASRAWQWNVERQRGPLEAAISPSTADAQRCAHVPQDLSATRAGTCRAWTRYCNRCLTCFRLSKQYTKQVSCTATSKTTMWCGTAWRMLQALLHQVVLQAIRVGQPTPGQAKRTKQSIRALKDITNTPRVAQQGSSYKPGQQLAKVAAPSSKQSRALKDITNASRVAKSGKSAYQVSLLPQWKCFSVDLRTFVL